jgi:ketosteroid isomerase-like protein
LFASATNSSWVAVCPSLIGAAGNELWATGEFSETGQGKNSEPIPIKGHWACICVREADDWKIRMCAWNFTPESVILVNKNSAPQPVATQSRTASHCTQ